MKVIDSNEQQENKMPEFVNLIIQAAPLIEENQLSKFSKLNLNSGTITTFYACRVSLSFLDSTYRRVEWKEEKFESREFANRSSDHNPVVVRDEKNDGSFDFEMKSLNSEAELLQAMYAWGAIREIPASDLHRSHGIATTPPCAVTAPWNERLYMWTMWNGSYKRPLLETDLLLVQAYNADNAPSASGWLGVGN